MFVASTSEDLFFFSLLVQRKEPTRFQTEYLGRTRWNGCEDAIAKEMGIGRASVYRALGEVLLKTLFISYGRIHRLALSSVQ